MHPSPYERPLARSAPPPVPSIEETLVPSQAQRHLLTRASKRVRGEIACAECRRLKIRCDKTVPCSTCVKRGCAALCPNGTIPPGDSSRFVLAATEHLELKLAQMEARKHSLEDALAILSDKPHPLLNMPETEDAEDAEFLDDAALKLKAVDDASESAVEAIGALHIDGTGVSRFFGPSGGSESLLLQAESVEKQRTPHLLRELDTSYLPPEILHCSSAFPFMPPGFSREPIQEMIESFLPPMGRAVALCETFLEHLSWMFHIVSRRQLFEELIPAIYKRSYTVYGPHDLAVLLITLGIGALVDLEQQPYNLEAQHYYRLARAALMLQSVMSEASIVTIKTLHLMSIYNGLSGKESNMEASYGFLDMACQVALMTGMHIDPSMWGFRGQQAYDRRIYFWNLCVAMLWQSLVTGRPPSILSQYIDCRIPTEEEEDMYGGGGPPTGLGAWGHRVSHHCLLPVVRITLAVKTPAYEQVLALDEKLRNLVQPLPNSDDEGTAISMKNFIRSHYRDLMSLFLHRAFFAQAMMDRDISPCKSPFLHSVLAAYHAACTVLEDTVEQFSKKPLLVARVWRIWSWAFSASVVIGTMAIRGIDLNLNPPPLPQFQIACSVFRSAAETSNRAARALPILQSMLNKAHHAHQLYLGETRVPLRGSDEEISVFSGRVSQPKKVLGLSPDPKSDASCYNPPSSHHRIDREVPYRDCVDHELGALGAMGDRWDSFMHHSDVFGT